MKNAKHWIVEIKQVDNGFVLKVTDAGTYSTTETVYRSTEEALDALRKTFDHVEGSYLNLPATVEEE